MQTIMLRSHVLGGGPDPVRGMGSFGGIARMQLERVCKARTFILHTILQIDNAPVRISTR